jgi:hypothetical protein
MLSGRIKELSLLAQKIGERQGCVVCGKKPTLWVVSMKGYCATHKADAEKARRNNYLKFVGMQDVRYARKRDSTEAAHKKWKETRH